MYWNLARLRPPHDLEYGALMPVLQQATSPETSSDDDDPLRFGHDDRDAPDQVNRPME